MSLRNWWQKQCGGAYAWSIIQLPSILAQRLHDLTRSHNGQEAGLKQESTGHCDCFGNWARARVFLDVSICNFSF